MAAPLTPPQCDLQDFPFMPLHVARLRDSDLAAEEKPEACWYAVLLWAASWHQLPAGSLPDNDAILARLIGLGRDIRTFRRHKAAAMRGFTLCDDGRLYHPVVAEQVIAAWNSKLQQRWRTECARVKKANQRNGTELPQPSFEEFLSSENHGPGPGIVPEDEASCPPGQSLQGTGTGTERFKEPPTPSGGCSGRSLDFDKALAAWPVAGRGNHGGKLSWAEWPGAADRAGGEDRLLAATQARAAWLAAHPDERVKAFHRWLRDDGFEAYLGKPGGPASVSWLGPKELWDAVVRSRPTGEGEGFAISWLAPCRWLEAERKVATPSQLVFDKLRSECATILAGFDAELIFEQERAV